LRRASLYHYVGSKEELLYQVVSHGLTAAIDELEQAVAISDPRARLTALIRHRVRLVVKSRNMFTVILDHRPLVRAADEPTIRKLEKRYSELFEATVASAVSAGALPEMDTRYAVNAVMGLTTWVYKWFRSESDDPEAFADACVRLIVT
jgi:AcrR family transcriptional regulator